MSEAFLKKFCEGGAQRFVSNADVQTASIDGLPLTIASKKSTPSCSTAITTAHYIEYPKQTLSDHPWIPYALKIAPPLFGWHRLNKAVYINNWLFSTNLYPEINPKRLIETLSRKYPEHALFFPSITPEQDPELAARLKEAGCTFIPRRPVYLTDTSEARPFKSRMFKSDLKILKNTPYTIADEVPAESAPRIAELYQMLNCTKYSPLNPQYTPHFVQDSHLEWRLLIKGGQVDAALGFYEQNGVLTSPFFGYDTSKPEELGLYRQIATLLALEAKERALLLNHSGGAGNFKKLRRARPVLEYIAVYTKHLPLKQKLSWQSLKLVAGEGQFKREM